MRPDGKPEGLRQSMSWLHTWCGLLLGWLLYAVFFTGTLSYFLDEINDWMRPELHRSIPGPQTAALAMAAMQKIAPDATTWTINLPGERQTAVEASWRKPGAAAGRAGTQRVHLDAGTGEVIEPRETRGGSFLYRFHFELHAMPRIWGRWIVGIATMFMFVAIITGVITHKKIFKEFFTFRPRKGQRSWLDAHNATAVLALPFHVVITFSGLLLFMSMLMPWGVKAVYDGDMQRYFAESRGRAAGGAGEREGAGRAGRAQAAEPAALASIAPMMEIAQAHWPERGVGSIVVQRPGTPQASIELREQGARSVVRGAAGERLLFDGVTGEPRNAPEARVPSTAQAVSGAMMGIHLGRFADPGLRWLLFLSGVVGTVMAGSGLVLWVVKRLPERRKLGRTPHGHRLVEVLNIGAIAGLSVATAAYFWANRLLPVDVAQRADVEIRCFFIVWGLCLAHGLSRTHRRAWLEQLWLAAVAFAALPLLNAATGGIALPAAMLQGQWSVAGFDLVALAFAVLHGFAAWKLGASAGLAAAPRPAGGAGVRIPRPVAQSAEKQA
ncbi:PepSY-associated TM helix domain-containing protein [Comamonas endophytica]|uniref:PepSY domain-containing protein n=1 Tax=Comamonas endophytica TaxID=2949090 RepID=A0ABY6GAM7_9BURK|nr:MULTISPECIES: PepSY-associated TM helix domain-containing protein [unclassified Acidovorax]MCD2511882.1 PepSY domain-containing protein [Acidovorax sp. D4N7]UYG51602.1 PepSY domain-containing protein [Acidovorax sp. 5MLIR]